MDNSANFIFLDQFGIKFIDREFFTQFINLPTTDIMFFISSSIINRFPSDPNVQSILGIEPDVLARTSFNEIQNGNLKNDLEVFIFSINKGFLARHITPVIKRLKNENRIKVKHPAFTSATVLKKDREPHIIKII